MCFFLRVRRPPRSTPCPYTGVFRDGEVGGGGGGVELRGGVGAEGRGDRGGNTGLQAQFTCMCQYFQGQVDQSPHTHTHTHRCSVKTHTTSHRYGTQD